MHSPHKLAPSHIARDLRYRQGFPFNERPCIGGVTGTYEKNWNKVLGALAGTAGSFPSSFCPCLLTSLNLINQGVMDGMDGWESIYIGVRLRRFSKFPSPTIPS